MADKPHDMAIHNIGSDEVILNNTKCPDCGNDQFEMRNYSLMWHDGDIHCARCGKFIRSFDAG
jgi:ribosomal protein S27AE